MSIDLDRQHWVQPGHWRDRLQMLTKMGVRPGAFSSPATGWSVRAVDVPVNPKYL